MTDWGARDLLRSCLERRKRDSWNPEEAARANFRLAEVLKQRGKMNEAESFAAEASRVRRTFLREYPDQLIDNAEEEVVFDQMVSLWAGRFTGKLRDGAQPD